MEYKKGDTVHYSSLKDGSVPLGDGSFRLEDYDVFQGTLTKCDEPVGIIEDESGFGAGAGFGPREINIITPQGDLKTIPSSQILLPQEVARFSKKDITEKVS